MIVFAANLPGRHEGRPDAFYKLVESRGFTRPIWLDGKGEESVSPVLPRHMVSSATRDSPTEGQDR